MSVAQRESLNQELTELFDMKKAKARKEKMLEQEATEAQKDIRLLILMFRDGIPDVSIPMSDAEVLVWDSRNQQLLYKKDHQAQVVEGISREVMARLRPYLIEIVKKAKEFYN
jgi:hypothetical protein